LLPLDFGRLDCPGQFVVEIKDYYNKLDYSTIPFAIP